MSFVNRNFSVIAYANGFTQWHYVDTEKTMRDIYMVNYFGEVYALMAVGDVIILNAKDGTCMLVVTKIENKKVWTKPMNEVKY